MRARSLATSRGSAPRARRLSTNRWPPASSSSAREGRPYRSCSSTSTRSSAAHGSRRVPVRVRTRTSAGSAASRGRSSRSEPASSTSPRPATPKRKSPTGSPDTTASTRAIRPPPAARAGSIGARILSVEDDVVPNHLWTEAVDGERQDARRCCRQTRICRRNTPLTCAYIMSTRRRTGYPIRVARPRPHLWTILGTNHTVVSKGGGLPPAHGHEQSGHHESEADREVPRVEGLHHRNPLAGEVVDRDVGQPQGHQGQHQDRIPGRAGAL